MAPWRARALGSSSAAAGRATRDSGAAVAQLVPLHRCMSVLARACMAVHACVNQGAVSKSFPENRQANEVPSLGWMDAGAGGVPLVKGNSSLIKRGY